MKGGNLTVRAEIERAEERPDADLQTARPASSKRTLIFAFTIFLGAFLLFQVQPLLGKFILPWFGGGPGVWTTCLLFFQLVLLGGYAYAHWSSRRLSPRRQALLHLLLLVAAVGLLPIVPGEAWKPRAGGNPVLQILAVLSVSVGVPYFVLSTTGPLLQHWFSRTNPGASPYRLYALSNAGSLLALLTYPVYFETHFTRRVQATIWDGGLVVYATGCALCAFKIWRRAGESLSVGAFGTPHRTATDDEQRGGSENRPPAHGPEEKRTPHPGPLPFRRGEGESTPPQEPRSAWGQRNSPHPYPSPKGRGEPCPFLQKSRGSAAVLWVLLPACASLLLLATTNKLCQDVAVVPFLWVVPLALYLLSFIVCFDSPRWYHRLPFTVLLAAALAGLCWALGHSSDWPLWKQVLVYCGGLFVCCMVCHGELYRLRPAPERLTGFYLAIAAGGALGGLLVAVVAPIIFTNYYELHWGLFGCGLLFVVVWAMYPVRREGRQGLVAEEEKTTKHTKDTKKEGGGTVGDVLLAGATAAQILDEQSNRRDAMNAEKTNRAESLRSSRLCGLFRLHFLGYGFAALRLSWFSCTFARVTAFLRRIALALRICVVALQVVGLVFLGRSLWRQVRHGEEGAVFSTRNFYGVLTVFEYRKNEPLGHNYLLLHGRITHGFQFVDPRRATWPISYYGEGSGVSLGWKALPEGPRRLGVVGLGTGTLAAYARRGDYVRFYEINPEVKRLATSRFTYISNSTGKAEIVLGDARLSMEKEAPQAFDMLALDAFSSDAIPVHLLTREAFELYRRHLKPNGIIAVHISNHFLDLEPVVMNVAREFKYNLATIDCDETEEEWWLYASTWVLLSQGDILLHNPAIPEAANAPRTKVPAVRLWTDDFASLFQILNKK